jgi:uncharacterized protein YkwD
LTRTSADVRDMRALAALGAFSVLVLGSAPQAFGLLKNPSGLHSGSHVRAAGAPLQRVSARVGGALFMGRAARPQGKASPTVLLSALEADIVARINAQRGARGLRPLRVSRGLTASANYHSHQMGLFGFFEHESRNGAPFWRRIARFYPSRHYRYWSVGENIFWESPETSGPSAVHEWMMSAPHRENILTRQYREVGVAAVHFSSAGGAFGGRPVTIVTADFGVRR